MLDLLGGVMTLFNKYRWIQYYNLFRYEIPYFLTNLWLFRKALWSFRTWDNTYLYQIILTALEASEKATAKYSHHTCKDRTCKDIRVCILLLRRLIADEYLIDKTNFEFGRSFFDFKMSSKYFLPVGVGKSSLKLSKDREKLDRELLFKILSRKSKSWWY